MRKFSHSKSLVLLFVLLLAFQPLLAQKKIPGRQSVKRPASRKAQVPDAVISELSEMVPLLPESPEDAQSEEDETKPPSDDAPLEKLLAYWKGKTLLPGDKSKLPSDVIRQRILEACINRPSLFVSYLTLLPNTPATHDQLYRLIQETPEDEAMGLLAVREYLKRNSQYFRDELLVEAQQGNVEILAKLDWDAAKPMVERLLSSNEPAMVAKGLGLSREHALKISDTSQADSALTKLKELVVNSQFDLAARSEALKHVMNGEWNGQEDWFVGLFSDAALSGLIPKNLSENPKNIEGKASSIRAAGSATGASGAVASAAAAAAQAATRVAPSASAIYDDQPNLLTEATNSDGTKWIPKILKLVGNTNPVIHNAAVRYLVEQGSPFIPGKYRQGLYPTEMGLEQQQEIARALLPWLQNSNWSTAPGRERFIQNLGSAELRECIPGLIAVLNTEVDEQVLDAAISAVKNYKDPNAVPSLKRLLQQSKTEEIRAALVTAIALANGFSDAEMASAYEVYSRKAATEKGEEELMEARNSEKLLPLNLSIGMIFFESEEIPATDGLLQIIFARVKELRQTHPAVAQKMLAGIQRVPFRIAQLNLIERLREGDVDALTVSYMLEDRKELQKHVSDSIYPLLSQGGFAAGIASVLLGDAARMQDILKSKDEKAQLAVLVCARHLREKLFVSDVTPLLNNPALSEAVESYLEIENSVTGRNILWVRHPNQAWIVGEKWGSHYGDPSEAEIKLQKEILSPDGADAIYAVLAPFERSGHESVVVRVKKDSAQISLITGSGYRKIRELTSSELQEIKHLTAQPEIEDLNPEIYQGNEPDDGEERNYYDYLRLTKESGRRISLAKLQRTPKKDATLHEQLAGLFYSLIRSGEFQLRYDLEDKIKGLEVLWSNPKQKALMVAQEKKELRLMVAREESPFPRNRSENELPFSWRVFESGQLGGTTDPPFLYAEIFASFKSFAGMPVFQGQGLSMMARAGDNIYAVIPYPTERQGIIKFSPGMKEPVKISDKTGSGLVVTPGEKWLVMTKISLEVQKPESPALIRINLQTGKEFDVKLPTTQVMTSHTYLADRKLILIAEMNDALNSNAFLLDPETGNLQSVKGDFRPIIKREMLPLQPTGNPHEYWATINDPAKKISKLGRYSTDTFTFSPVFELPDLEIREIGFWVDESAGKIYFVHDGNLLSLALPKK